MILNLKIFKWGLNTSNKYAVFNNKPNLNVRYEKTKDFATMIIVKDLFKDNKTLISYYLLP